MRSLCRETGEKLGTGWVNLLDLLDLLDRLNRLNRLNRLDRLSFARKEPFHVDRRDPLVLQDLSPYHGFPRDRSAGSESLQLVSGVGAVLLLIDHADEVPLLFRFGHASRVFRFGVPRSQATRGN